MPQSIGDVVFGQMRSVVALDQQGNASALADVPRPGERVIEPAEFLERKLVLFEGRD